MPSKEASWFVIEHGACDSLGGHFWLFLAALRGATRGAACELCAAVTSNPPRSVPRSRLFPRVGTLGYRARRIWCGSHPVTARYSALGAVCRSNLPAVEGSPSCASRMVSPRAALSKLLGFDFSAEAGRSTVALPLFNESRRVCLDWLFGPTLSTSSTEFLTSAKMLIGASFLWPQLSAKFAVWH